MSDSNDHSPSHWPIVRQILQRDVLGLDGTASSSRTETLEPRTNHADRVVPSICPYCAVGCAQLVYVQNERITNIEGDPASPISHGCLCPKGSATFQLVTGSHRVKEVLYRRPHGTKWELIPLEQAMDMVAERVKRTRDEQLGGSQREGRAAPPYDGHRAPGRSDAGQRRELPDQEALHLAGDCPDRKPGPYMTLLHGPQFGDIVRAGRRDHLPTGSAARRLHRD